MEIFVRRSLPTSTIVLDTYWKFACERQNVFYNKINNIKPLTHDLIISEFKFTNVYRASDRVSQYLINKVIYKKTYSEKDTLLRILLFKIFNKIETWELIESFLGDITTETFSFNKISNLLKRTMASKTPIYSAAYIMASGKSIYGYDKKHDNHLKLLEDRLINGSLFTEIKNANKFDDIFIVLKSLPTFGDFLSYQLAIDINYSEMTSFSEMDFVVAGPGAKDGIQKCFSDLKSYSYSDIIKYITEIQEKEFDRLNLNFKKIGNRELQLIDCQNIFCETDKYSRVKHPEFVGLSERTRIKQKYKAEKSPISCVYPPKWNVPPILINV